MAELTEQADAFDQAHNDLFKQYSHWHRPTGVLAVPRTNVDIEHPDKLENMDLAPLLDAIGGDIHIVVPILVVEELDRLKCERGPACAVASQLHLRCAVVTNHTRSTAAGDSVR